MVYGTVRKLFIDEEAVLTLQVSESCHSAKPTFYRFPLKCVFLYDMKLVCLFRKSDSLKNLAWFSIRRDVMLFGRNVCDKIRSDGLKSLFIGYEK
jgi:hypothetical protein